MSTLKRFPWGTLVAANKNGTIRRARGKDSPIGIVSQIGNVICKDNLGNNIHVIVYGDYPYLRRQGK